MATTNSGVGGHGRGDLLVGYDHGAVGRTAAHLHAVGRQVGDVLAFEHGGARQSRSHREDALPAEAREDGLRAWDLLDHAQRKLLGHDVVDPVAGLDGAHLPAGRTGREDLDQREAASVDLPLEGLADGLLGLDDRGRLVDGARAPDRTCRRVGRRPRRSAPDGRPSPKSRPSGVVVVTWSSSVVGAIWPPVMPYTPLFTKITVMFSPRLAAWNPSAVPMAARSPSPW